MPVILDQIHPRVMQLTIAVPWTINELIAVYPAEQKMFDAADPNLKIYSIVDLSKMGAIPAGALRARVSPQVTHSNSAGVIIVGGSAFAQTLADTVFRLTHYRKVRFFATYNEAWAYVEPLLVSDQSQS